MFDEYPQKLRWPSRETRRVRTVRWIRNRRRPLGRVLQAIGRTDQRLLVRLRTRGHSPELDKVAQGLGIFGELGMGWIALAGTGAAVRPERRQRFAAAAGVAPVAIAVNYGIKRGIGRKRPLVDDHPPLARAPSKLSFPSAHSTSAVASAVALGRVSPVARPALLGLAGAICLSRPYLGMHYPSDVLSGAAIGWLIGRVFPLPAEPVRVERLDPPVPPPEPGAPPVAIPPAGAPAELAEEPSP